MNSDEHKPPIKPRPEDHVPIHKRMLWGTGGAADNFILNGINTLILPIYNIGLGVDVVLIGVAQTIPRIIDAFTDPLMGNISDNTRSRWGRRRPYIFVGAILTALIFMFLWTPPTALSHKGMFVYLLIGLIIYYLTYTVFVVPYTALGYEMTTDYNEKTRVIAWRQYIGLAAGLSIPWLYKLCFVFSPPGSSELKGVRYVALIVGAIILILGIVPALFCRERALTTQKKVPLAKAFSDAFRNKSFIILMAGNFIVKIALFMAAPCCLYLNIYYVCHGDRSFAATLMGLAGTLQASSGIIGLKWGTWLSARIGKREVVFLALGISFLANLSLWFAITPKAPYLQLVPLTILGIMLNAVWLLIYSLLGDVCNEDEYITGLRREGMFSAVFAFSDKLAFSLITLLSAFLLKMTGYVESLTVQSEQTIFNLRLVYVFIQCGGLLLGILIFCFYPLTRKRCEFIHEELLARTKETSLLQ